MTPFWQNLARLAHGQLFAGGYLSPATAAKLAAERRAETLPCSAKRRRTSAPWPRLAAYR